MATLSIFFELPYEIKLNFPGKYAPLNGYKIEREPISGAYDPGPLIYDLPYSDGGLQYTELEVPYLANAHYSFRLFHPDWTSQLAPIKEIKFSAIPSPYTQTIENVTLSLTPVFNFIVTVLKEDNLGPASGFLSVYYIYGGEKKIVSEIYYNGSSPEQMVTVMDYKGTYDFYFKPDNDPSKTYTLASNVEVNSDNFWSANSPYPYQYKMLPFYIPNPAPPKPEEKEVKIHFIFWDNSINCDGPRECRVSYIILENIKTGIQYRIDDPVVKHFDPNLGMMVDKFYGPFTAIDPETDFVIKDVVFPQDSHNIFQSATQPSDFGGGYQATVYYRPIPNLISSYLGVIESPNAGLIYKCPNPNHSGDVHLEWTDRVHNTTYCSCNQRLTDNDLIWPPKERLDVTNLDECPSISEIQDFLRGSQKSVSYPEQTTSSQCLRYDIMSINDGVSPIPPGGFLYAEEDGLNWNTPYYNAIMSFDTTEQIATVHSSAPIQVSLNYVSGPKEPFFIKNVQNTEENIYLVSLQVRLTQNEGKELNFSPVEGSAYLHITSDGNKKGIDFPLSYRIADKGVFVLSDIIVESQKPYVTFARVTVAQNLPGNTVQVAILYNKNGRDYYELYPIQTNGVYDYKSREPGEKAIAVDYNHTSSNDGRTINRRRAEM